METNGQAYNDFLRADHAMQSASLANDIVNRQADLDRQNKIIKENARRHETDIVYRKAVLEQIEAQTAAMESINRTLIDIEAAILGADTPDTPKS